MTENIKDNIIYNSIKLKLKYNDEFLLKINGSSMLPVIKSGDYVRVKCRDQNYAFGDIVLIDWSPTGAMSFGAHRLISIRKNITKGDNLQFPDVKGLKIICKIVSPHPRLDKIFGILSYIHMLLNSRKKRYGNLSD